MDYQQEILFLKDQIRHQKKITKISMILSTIVGSSLLLGAYKATHFNSLTVNRLAIIDSNGIERVILESDNNIVNVPSGTFGRNPKMSGVILQNANGHEVGGMGSGDNGMAAIILDSYSDKARYGATERIGMYTMPNGDASLFVVDLESNRRSELKSSADGKIDFWYK